MFPDQSHALQLQKPRQHQTFLQSLPQSLPGNTLCTLPSYPELDQMTYGAVLSQCSHPQDQFQQLKPQAALKANGIKNCYPQEENRICVSNKKLTKRQHD